MRILLWLFGLKIKKIGNIDMESSMFVSNHISFIDIIVINSIMDMKFIAKSEIQKWPVIGRLAEKSGTIFIKRGDLGDNSKVIDKIKSYINNKKKVVLFPEGRIGDGITIRKFHSKLFNSISNSELYLQPFYILYPKMFPKDLSNDLSLCWADKRQSLSKISLRCLGRYSTTVILCFKDAIKCNKPAYELAKLTYDEVISCDEIINTKLKI
tara:strand:+ start:131 stop:763 length:633 start_codon:yes stop_codon:yes gene_type:complete